MFSLRVICGAGVACPFAICDVGAAALRSFDAGRRGLGVACARCITDVCSLGASSVRRVLCVRLSYAMWKLRLCAASMLGAGGWAFRVRDASPTYVLFARHM